MMAILKVMNRIANANLLIEGEIDPLVVGGVLFLFEVLSSKGATVFKYSWQS